LPYRQRIDRHNPGCLVFLIDQSASMSEPIGGSDISKAVAVAEQLNTLLYGLVQRCSKSQEELPRPYFAVAAIGYGTTDDGEQVLDSKLRRDGQSDLMWTTDLVGTVIRVDERRRQTAGGGEATYRFPMWIEPAASGGTPMCAAFELAGRVLKGWTDHYTNAFPPIVINLTDGESTDGDPAPWADRLCRLETSDGNVLLFNAVVSSEAGAPTLFPVRPDAISDAFGVGLWALSSTLPAFMVDAARRRGIDVQTGGRGFAFNADLQSLVAFLNIGTDTGHLLR
jgi:hypothetical protein